MSEQFTTMYTKPLQNILLYSTSNTICFLFIVNPPRSFHLYLPHHKYITQLDLSIHLGQSIISHWLSGSVYDLLILLRSLGQIHYRIWEFWVTLIVSQSFVFFFVVLLILVTSPSLQQSYHIRHVVMAIAITFYIFTHVIMFTIWINH